MAFRLRSCSAASTLWLAGAEKAFFITQQRPQPPRDTGALIPAEHPRDLVDSSPMVSVDASEAADPQQSPLSAKPTNTAASISNDVFDVSVNMLDDATEMSLESLNDDSTPSFSSEPSVEETISRESQV